MRSPPLLVPPSASCVCCPPLPAAARRPPQLRKSIPKYTRKDFKDGKELDEDAFRKLIVAVKTGALIEDVQKSDEEIRALFNKVDSH